MNPSENLAMEIVEPPAQPTNITTQTVQGRIEEVPADISGGRARIPFGPPFRLEEDEDGFPIDPGYVVLPADDGMVRRAFTVAESIGLMPLLRFANAAKAGMDSDDLEGMAALYTMIQDCIEPDEWDTFVTYAISIKAEDDDLMQVVSGAMEVISARKARQRGSSSGTSPSTSAKSKANSSRRASDTPTGPHRPPELDGLMPVADLVR